MALYKLTADRFPLRTIYAREREDIERCLEALCSHEVACANLGITSESERSRFDQEVNSSKIVQAERGELILDLTTAVRLDEHGKLHYDSLNITPDFVAKITLESVPYFRDYQQMLSEETFGNVYTVCDAQGGKWYWISFIPKDVFEALKNYDISPHEERARRHIRALNVCVKGRMFPPKPTAHYDINN